MLSDIRHPSQGSLGLYISAMGAVSPSSKVSHTAPSKRSQHAPGWRVSQLTPQQHVGNESPLLWGTLARGSQCREKSILGILRGFVCSLWHDE